MFLSLLSILNLLDPSTSSLLSNPTHYIEKIFVLLRLSIHNILFFCMIGSKKYTNLARKLGVVAINQNRYMYSDDLEAAFYKNLLPFISFLILYYLLYFFIDVILVNLDFVCYPLNFSDFSSVFLPLLVFR